MELPNYKTSRSIISRRICSGNLGHSSAINTKYETPVEIVAGNLGRLQSMEKNAIQ